MQVPGFTEHVGPTRQLPRDATPIQFFLLLFTTKLIDLVVKYTNSNAVEMILSDAAGNVEGTLAWTPTSSEEIMAFLGIVILYGHREASFDTAVLVVVRKTSSAWGYNNISSRSLQPPFEILLLQ